jgi:hypothetical protein
MAGKRQHFIPRFLLRGFISKETKKESFTYITGRNSSPIETNIKNVAVESKFYEYQDVSADDYITDNEYDYAKAIEYTRTNETLTKQYETSVASFIESLVVRTKYFRSIITSSTNHLIDRTKEDLLKDENLIRLISGMLADDTILTKCIDDICKEHPEMDNNKIKQLCREKLESEKHNLAHFVFTGAKVVGPQLFSTLKDKTLPEIKTAQIDVLSKSRNETERFRQYKTLNWQAKTYTDNNLILGDIGPIAIEKNGDVVPPIFSKDVLLIILPISSSKIIVGSHKTPFIHLDSSEINMMSASLAVDFIISSHNSQILSKYSKIIGLKSERHYVDMIDNIFQQNPLIR